MSTAKWQNIAGSKKIFSPPVLFVGLSNSIKSLNRVLGSVYIRDVLQNEMWFYLNGRKVFHLDSKIPQKHPKYLPSTKDFFRTCNVLPFSCTHLAWCLTKDQANKSAQWPKNADSWNSLLYMAFSPMYTRLTKFHISKDEVWNCYDFKNGFNLQAS